MMRLFLAGALALAALGVAQPARAYEAPWCAVIDLGHGDAYWDCQYAVDRAVRSGHVGGQSRLLQPESGLFRAGAGKTRRKSATGGAPAIEAQARVAKAAGLMAIGTAAAGRV